MNSLLTLTILKEYKNSRIYLNHLTRQLKVARDDLEKSSFTQDIYNDNKKDLDIIFALHLQAVQRYKIAGKMLHFAKKESSCRDSMVKELQNIEVEIILEDETLSSIHKRVKSRKSQTKKEFFKDNKQEIDKINIISQRLKIKNLTWKKSPKDPEKLLRAFSFLILEIEGKM